MNDEKTQAYQYKPEMCPSCGYNQDNQTQCCVDLISVKADRDTWRSRAEILVEALESIIEYGKALQPNPVHPVTFNACAIAQEALLAFDAAKRGTK